MKISAVEMLHEFTSRNASVWKAFSDLIGPDAIVVNFTYLQDAGSYVAELQDGREFHFRMWRGFCVAMSDSARTILFDEGEQIYILHPKSNSK